MQIFLTILLFLVIFSFLILIHELGHFMAAKRAGVKVEEFGMGLPPRIWGIKKGETLYSINWIPFGGFVRMLGEDGGGKKSKRSFDTKSPAAQLGIVSAGVIMNFLAAFILLTVGFWIGIDPLLATEEDFYDGIRSGQVYVEPGLVVVESNEEYNVVDYMGEDLAVRSFDPGDRILEVEGRVISQYGDWEAVLSSLENSSPMASVDHADGRQGGEYLSLQLLEQLELAPATLPRLIYAETEGAAFSEVLEEGDVLLTMNESQILTEDDLYTALGYSPTATIEVFRPGIGELRFEDLTLPTHAPRITYVLPGSPAEAAALIPGDRILAIAGNVVSESTDVVVLNQAHKSEEGQIEYLVGRKGEELTVSLKLGEDNLAGVALSDRVDYYGNLSLYEGYALHTVMELHPEQHGLFKAPVVAVQEMWRLGKITAVMFLDVFKNFLGANEVPEGVAGPVGIAQMTFVAVQDGLGSVLRFVALLSLSLGVVNILPIPALDGGRAVFILYRGFTGHAPNPRIEQFIHMAGFFLLLLFIVYITFNDVLNLF